MDFAFNEEQEELRSIARAFLEEHSGSEQIRKAMESELGFDPTLWEQLGVELGWTSVHIPEAYGGLGLGYVELVALMEIMGGALVCAPFLSSICLAANTLLQAGDDAQREQHLPGIAEGHTRAALAFAGSRGGIDPDSITVTARRDGDDYVLQGAHSFVVDGHSADLVITAARAEGSSGEDGVSLFVLPGESADLRRRALPTMDQTRRLAELTFDSLRVPAAARLGEEGGAWPALSRALDLACVALAAEQVGGAQWCLDASVAYACEREQFGRPIGSFQSIKHKCADMLVAVESARSAVYYAGCVAAESGEELPISASLARAYCSEAYFRCAADAIQIHGGVGFTWEYDCHLHFKRARATESLLGEPASHRERVARHLGL